jgi:DNA repair exonuclease SbcCD ATPase subunit
LKAKLLEREKSYKELHSKVGQMSGELGELRKLREQVATDDKLAKVLEAATSLAAKREEKPAFDWDAYEASLADRMAEDPKEATKDLLKTMNAWMVQDREKVKGEAVKEIQTLKEQLSQVMEIVETTTDDYKENKELIEKLRKDGGLSVKKAKALAKELRDLMPASQRATPPTGISPTRVVPPEKRQELPYTDEDIKSLRDAGESEEVIEALKAKWVRDAQLSDMDRKRF